MREFVATFHTHLIALMTSRALTDAGFAARMAPVPRKLSSSCGTCVFYSAPDVHQELLDEDTERVYAVEEEQFVLVLELEEL